MYMCIYLYKCIYIYRYTYACLHRMPWNQPNCDEGNTPSLRIFERFSVLPGQGCFERFLETLALHSRLRTPRNYDWCSLVPGGWSHRGRLQVIADGWVFLAS